jgi:hypothetical protein
MLLSLHTSMKRLPSGCGLPRSATSRTSAVVFPSPLNFFKLGTRHLTQKHWPFLRYARNKCLYTSVSIHSFSRIELHVTTEICYIPTKGSGYLAHDGVMSLVQGSPTFSVGGPHWLLHVEVEGQI